jgi:isopenicillin-N epimerase
VTTLKDQFLLDSQIAYLNHGSYGACPRPVFEVYQKWQLRTEREPTQFFFREADPHLDAARATIGHYLNAAPDDLVFVPNATIGLNTVIRSLHLEPGDEILTTDHEYGALDYTWEFMCSKTGACYRPHPVPLPVTTHADFVESFWSAVTPRTRVIYISHMTSPTALIFPVEEVCRRARAAGILTIVDGAHIPGHIPLDLTALDADFYSGNFHKWLCAPRGSAFLYVKRGHHRLIEPLVISWGWPERESFVRQNQWQGTRELAAFLSVPAAIEFQEQHNWNAVRAACHDLVRSAQERIARLAGVQQVSPSTPEWFAQMVTLLLPPCDVEQIERTLLHDYKVDIPVRAWRDHRFIRVSIQGYNTANDIDRLLNGLEAQLGTG